ncbi:MAG: GTP 3',8-cyclase MoaA [Candidatus Magnetoovum sp. WYHC-5]|nr:GTP 3',8-cyclase MoaA [Candidatus Magnetoovum sp. WYHC-5]
MSLFLWSGMKLEDKYNRVIDYMRISITGRCNLRCVYCIPDRHSATNCSIDYMSAEEILKVVECAVELGVKKIRITGGEPLIRGDIGYIIKKIKELGGVDDLSVTTNGIKLAKYAFSLKEAGLERVNISLDSLNPQRFAEITNGGLLSTVFDGIKAAEKAGLLPIKINMVPIRGINDDEIEDFAKLTFVTNYHIRFIELMPFNKGKWWTADKLISTEEIKSRIEKIAPLEPVKKRQSGPARYYKFSEALGVVGFISPITHHFCNQCNRLRLTSEGKLRPCLFMNREIDLLSEIRKGAGKEEIKAILLKAVEVKPEGHRIVEEKDPVSQTEMSKIGG